MIPYFIISGILLAITGSSLIAFSLMYRFYLRARIDAWLDRKYRHSLCIRETSIYEGMQPEKME